MDCYKGFAQMYDRFMKDVPYEHWAIYIDRILKKQLINVDTPFVLDLACGTGNMTLPLARLGYDMIGVDISADMLACAQQKAWDESLSILFLAQDMRVLDLYGTIHAVVSVCDGLNYILDEDELCEVFRRVALFLEPGGVFIFDMNTAFKYHSQLANNTFTAETDDEEYIWDNQYNETTAINEYHMTFINTHTQEAFTELHKQRAYALDAIYEMLTIVGFSRVLIKDGYTVENVRADSLRAVFVAYM